MINPQVKITTVENTPDDPRQRKPDITKAKELLGWEPKIKLNGGIPLMEEDFRKRLGIPRKWSGAGFKRFVRVQFPTFCLLNFVGMFLVGRSCLWLRKSKVIELVFRRSSSIDQCTFLGSQFWYHQSWGFFLISSFLSTFDGQIIGCIRKMENFIS